MVGQLNFDERRCIYLMRVKKMLCILLLLFCMASISCKKEEVLINDVCYNINKLVRDYNFASGNIKNKTIYLYDNDRELLIQLSSGDLDSTQLNKILYFYKKENQIYFVLTRSVDDEEGILYINDENNNILSGIWSVKRIGGNSYVYNTRP